jgi:D-alanine-D-alanine ligase
MHIGVLFNRDHDLLAEDPGRAARADVVRVASVLCDTLASLRHDVQAIPVGPDVVGFVDTLRRRPPELVVNLCESLVADSRGEMAVPCLLELLRVPYTGSPPLALGLALHKHLAKDILKARGIATPEFRLVERADQLLGVDLPFPLIVKPCREDASVGMSFDAVASDKKQLARAVRYVLKELNQPALVERYVEGREIYVSLLGNNPRRALPLTEIRFGPSFADRPKIVSYCAKWDEASTECVDSPAVRAKLPAELEARVVETASRAFDALGCRDYGRVDIRLDPSGEAFVIDINPNCDLHPTAGFAKAALEAGTSYPALVRTLVDVALERSHGDTKGGEQGSRESGPVARPNRNVLARRGGLRAGAHRRRAQAE